MNNRTLSLESLVVESFATQSPSFADAEAPSRNYSECLTCGIACTYNCPLVTLAGCA